MRRLIEDENTKRRKALRRHYNETVRELATFVRKRDKRVLAHNVGLSGGFSSLCDLLLPEKSTCSVSLPRMCRRSGGIRRQI